jgi:hypothetical protein
MFGLLGVLGGILGGAAGGASKSRESQNNAIAQNNRNQIDLHQAQQQALMQALGLTESSAMNRANLDLNQRQFALQAPSVRGKQALLGSLMQNIQPVSFGNLSPQLRARMPQISGGLNPSAIGPLARQMGSVMQRNALQGQMRGDQFAALPQINFLGGVLEAPKLQQMKQPGLLEKILGGAGLAGSLIGGLGALNGGGSQPMNLNSLLSPLKSPVASNLGIPTRNVGLGG